MEIKEIDYKGFGKCVRMSNGIIDVDVTIDFGPRIIRFGFCNKENLFYNDIARVYKIKPEKQDMQETSENTFYYYGGHMLLSGPNRYTASVSPDNEPVVYSPLPDGVRFIQPKPKGKKVQFGFEVIMGEDAADIMVVHMAKNCSDEVQPCSLWPVTMIKGGGLMILPQNTDTANSLYPNRTISFWPGTDIHDSRIFYGNRYITINYKPGCERALKIGCNNVFGCLVFVGKNYTFMKRYVHSVKAAYPDFGSSCEICCKKDFAEIQSLSPIYRIEPGHIVKHVENLSAFPTKMNVSPTNEDEISRYIENMG